MSFLKMSSPANEHQINQLLTHNGVVKTIQSKASVYRFLFTYRLIRIKRSDYVYWFYIKTYVNSFELCTQWSKRCLKQRWLLGRNYLIILTVKSRMKQYVNAVYENKRLKIKNNSCFLGVWNITGRKRVKMTLRLVLGCCSRSKKRSNYLSLPGFNKMMSMTEKY